MRESAPLVALVGPPNAGKTTLFNWLTGSSFRAVNYPGATVDCYLGSTVPELGAEFRVLDTPGTYSLHPKSPDERVTYQALFQSKFEQGVSHVIVVVDGTQLSRQLILPLQLKACGFRVSIAVTMSDLLKDSKAKPDFSVLEKEFGGPVVAVDGLAGAGIKELAQAVGAAFADGSKMVSAQEPKTLAVEADLRRSVELSEKVLGRGAAPVAGYMETTRRWDRWLLHPIVGSVFFFAVMALFFSSIFWLAAPLMDAVDTAFSALADLILQLGPKQLWSDFLAHGLIASFAAVLVFVPQIYILFLGLGLLEDSGYLARAATLIDKPFSKFGLSGRSFVPLLSGFACAVPAMMATRNVRSGKERLLALLILPLMTCSARLPVYALLLGFLFWGHPAWQPGLVMAGIYLLSLVLGAAVAAVLNLLIKGREPSTFMMELPIYRRPKTRVVFRQAYMRTQAYVKRAGPVIFILALLIWGATSFPRMENGSPTEQITSSYAGQAGRYMEPVFEPMGVDWRVGLGLMSAFAAREVFVSSMAVIFNLSDSDDESTLRNSLISSMKSAKFESGGEVFTHASVAALIVYFLIALQCMSTTAMAAREMGSSRLAWIQLAVYNVLAYLAAVGTYQVLA